MCTHEDFYVDSSGPLAGLALLVDQPWHSAPVQRRHHLIDHVAKVAREEQVLKIRHARLLAWMKGTDLSLTAFPNWTAFQEEHSLWKGSRTRELIRLVESSLDLIKMAVSCSAMPLTLATRAAKELPPDATALEQINWMTTDPGNSVPERDRSRLVQIVGKDVRIVEQARAIAKVLVGWSAPDAVFDRFIEDCFKENATATEVLERARAVPPKPERLGKKVPDWEPEPRPALAGVWVEPRDQKDAMAQLKENRWRLEQRRLILGMAYAHIQDHEIWRVGTGCKSLAEFCKRHLDLDQRTFQRCAREGRDLQRQPEARKAIERGLTVDRACFAVEHGRSDTSLEPWLDLANRLDAPEMKRAAELEERADVAYAPALAMAKAVEAMLADAQRASEDDATPIGGPVGHCVGGEVATSIGDHEADSAQHLAGCATPIGGLVAQGIGGVASTTLGGDATDPAGRLGGNATPIGGPVPQSANERDATPIGGPVGQGASGEDATPIGADVEMLTWHVRVAVGTPVGPIRVALRDATYVGPIRPPPSSMYIPHGLLPAAKWFVEAISLPEEYGTRKTITRDRNCCQNPRCRRVTVHLHSHHIHPQEFDGCDEDWNLISLCTSCHLRGIHSSRIRLVRLGDWLLWTWNDGGVAITHSPMSAA